MPHLHLTDWGDWLPKPIVGTCYACDPDSEVGHRLVGDPLVHLAEVGETSFEHVGGPEVEAA